jgi:hypothetical protein
MEETRSRESGMRKTVVMMGLVLAATLALSGCDWLFGPSVAQVNPEDLASYTAAGTIPADETSVLNATSFAAEGASYGPATVYEDDVATATGFSIQEPTFESVFNALVAKSVESARAMAFAQSRSVTVEDESDFTDTEDFEIDVTVDITDETVNGNEVWPIGGGGTATIESFFLEITGSGTSDETTFEFAARGEQEGEFTYNQWTDGTNFIIHDGQVNTEGSGRVDIDIELTSGGSDLSGSLFWRFGYAMSAGLSFSDLVENEGGKIIVDFSYRGRESISFDTFAELEDQATGEFEATMTVRVYDNANNLVSEHTYTDEEVYESGIL